MTTKSQIKPLRIGRLAYQEQDGSWSEEIHKLYFLKGYSGIAQSGRAMTTVFYEGKGTCLVPVSRVISIPNKNIYEPLVLPGFAGLYCSYDKTIGTLSNFYEE